MISFKYKFIFIHVPKTGGRSVVKLLENIHEKNESLQFHHNNLTFIKTGYPLHKDIRKNINDYDVFSVVRNPYERMISYFFHLKLRLKNDDFKSFDKKEFISFLLNSYGTNMNYPSQLSYFNNETVNIIRFENFEKELRQVLDKYTIKCSIPKINTTVHEHYSKYYDNETRAIIENLYKDDLEQFGYTFETG